MEPLLWHLNENGHKVTVLMNEKIRTERFNPGTQFNFSLKIIQVLVLVICFLGGLATVAKASVIKGKVYNKKTNESLPGASVSLAGTSMGAAADRNGNYVIRNVPAGHYTLKVQYIGFITYTKKISIKKNQTLKVDVGLRAKTQRMKTITVFSTLNQSSEMSSRQAEKTAENEKNVVSSKNIESSPDISTSNVLQRLSGVTQEKSVGSGASHSIIRGLKPRYNTTLINGIKIASPNNKQRFVSTSLIPSDLLQKIEVNKTLTPSMEGDAIGGTVNLIFKNAPDHPIFSVKGAIGYGKALMDRKYTSFNRSVINQKDPNQIHGVNYQAKKSDFTRANLDFKHKTALPNGTASITYGQRFFNKKLGLLIGDTFHNIFNGEHSLFHSIAPKPYTTNKFVKLDVSRRSISSQHINNGLNANLDYRINDHNQIKLDNVFIYSDYAQARTNIDTTLRGSERTGPGTGYITKTPRSITQKKHIENLKLSGKDLLTNRLKLNWAGALSIAGQRQPDRAQVVTFLSIRQGGKRTPTYFYHGTHLWQRNNDHDYTGKADLAYRMQFLKQKLVLKTGGFYRKKNRYNQQDRYILKPTVDQKTGQAPVFTNIYNLTNFKVYNPRGTSQYDNSNYNANEEIGAGYAQFNLTVNKWQLLGGVRVEHTNESFHTRQFKDYATTSSHKNYTDILPNIHIRYNLNPRQDLRLSYYKSISRAGYYELVPYTQPGLTYDVKGNPGLKHTVADNFDLRYGLYPNAKDQVLAGVFYKRIKNPIEQALNTLSLSRSGRIVYQPQNFGTAHNYGFELQFTKYAGDFSFTGNYTYTHSHITSPKISNTPDSSFSKMESRPLQGQSDHVANAAIAFQKSGFYSQVDLQYVGKTLSKITAYYNADYYRKPQFSIALSLRQNLGHFTIYGKFENLLSTPSVIHLQNSFDVVRNTHKATGLIGLKYSL